MDLNGKYTVLQGSLNGNSDLILEYIGKDKYGWHKMKVYNEGFPIQLLDRDDKITHENKKFIITDTDKVNGFIWIVEL